MDVLQEQIREQQKESWNRFAAGWKKWDQLTMEFLRPAGEEIIRMIHPGGQDLVLDVAAGTGEPGLTIASMLKGGKVISVDLAEEMLKVAAENAARRGIQNFESQVADVSELPFEDNTFDALSCRFGYMFFPDMLQATREMLRVLKPGGRMAVSVWNVPEKNFWVTAVTDTIHKHIELPALPPGAPGMFRCAEKGLIAGLFNTAGLRNVLETEVRSQLKSGTAERYWEMMTEVGAALVAALSKADDTLKNKIKSEVFDSIHRHFPDGQVAFETSALVISGEK